jgi:hypothetical protein
MHGQDCYCLPYAHLTPFYEIIGFETVSDAELQPPERTLTEHHNEMSDPKIQRLMQDDLGVYPRDGLKYIAMKRTKVNVRQLATLIITSHFPDALIITIGNWREVVRFAA